MTFTDILTECLDRLNLSSSAGSARIGHAINAVYKQVTSTLGIDPTSRRTTVSAQTSLGSAFVTFTGVEKILRVVDADQRELTQVMPGEIEAIQPGATPSRWAVTRHAAQSVTIRLDAVMQDEITLQATGYEIADVLAGDMVPAFPESFHDVLVLGVMVREYLKTEHLAEARIAKQEYESRIGDLQFFLAKSQLALAKQGRRLGGSLPSVSSGSGAIPTGIASYTQTGLVTFDRDPGAPFAVAPGSAVVPNLDADLLDGQHGSHYLDPANHGFVQAGADAVERSGLEKMREVISVTDFGAVADGMTDCTDAFRAAIAAAVALQAAHGGGVTITIPAGEFILNNNGVPFGPYDAVLRVPAGITVQGAGRGQTVLRCTHNFGTAFQPATRFIRLEGDHAGCLDLTLVGMIDADSRHPRTGLAIEGASHCTVRNVHSKDFYIHAFLIGSTVLNHPHLPGGVPANYNEVENFLFERGHGSAMLIYSTPDGAGVKNVGNRLTNGLSRNADTFFGLEIRYSDRNQITNVILEGNQQTNHAGLNLEQSSSDNLFTNVVIRDNYNGVIIYGVTGKPRRNRFVNCLIDDNLNHGVLNNNGEFTSFLGTSISRSGGRGYFDFLVTTAPAGVPYAIDLAPTSDAGWEVGETVTSSPGGGSATVMGYDPVQRVLYVDVIDDFAVADTVTQGTNTGTVTRLSTQEPQAVAFTDCEVSDNGGYGINALPGCDLRVLDSRLIGNIDRGINPHETCTGLIRGNLIRTTLVDASTAQTGDIFVNGAGGLAASRIRCYDNDLTRASATDARTYMPPGWTEGTSAPVNAASLSMFEVETDADSASRSRRVRRTNAIAFERFVSIPLGAWAGYPAAAVQVRVRVKDDGSGRGLDWVWEASSGSVTTNGSGQWSWITITIPISTLTASTLLVIRRTSNTGQVLFDGYVLTPGPLVGSKTFDPPSLSDGDEHSETVTVTGAALGQMAEASFSLDLQGLQLTAWVSAANTVTVRLRNGTGGTVDLGSGTLRAKVRSLNQ